MTPRPIRRSVSAVIAMFLTALFLLGAGLAVQANAGIGVRGDLFQDPEYPFPDEFETLLFDDYPVDTPFYPFDDDLTPEESATEAISATPPLNKMATEDAEMRDTLGTPFPSATAAPSITPIHTQPTQGEFSPTVALVGAQERTQGHFRIDWGFFWAGFAVPVLVACGVVLYLLDRRPDLFAPRKKL